MRASAWMIIAYTQTCTEGQEAFDSAPRGAQFPLTA